MFIICQYPTVINPKKEYTVISFDSYCLYSPSIGIESTLLWCNYSFTKKTSCCLFCSVYAYSTGFSSIRKMAPHTEAWHLVPMMQMMFFIVQRISDDVEFQVPRLISNLYDWLFKDKAFLCKYYSCSNAARGIIMNPQTSIRKIFANMFPSVQVWESK